MSQFFPLALLLLIALSPTPLVWAETAPQEPDPTPVGLSEYVIEISSFSSHRQARDVRNLLNHLAPSRVEGRDDPQKGRVYRVLVGKFSSLSRAETFIRENHFKRLFAHYWVNPVRIDHKEIKVPQDAERPSAIEDPHAEKPDPYTLEAHLYCNEKERKGTYQAEFKGEPGITAGPVAIHLHWSCQPKSSEAKPHERSTEPQPESTLEFPSYFAVSAVGGYASLSMNHSTVGEVSPGGLVYGAEVAAYTNLFRGIGPVLDYRFLARRLRWGNDFSTTFDQRLDAGVNLPLGRFFELQPVAGFFSQNFIAPTPSGQLDFRTLYVPQFGLFGKVNLLRPKNGIALDITGKAHYLIPMATSSGNSLSGFQVGGAFRTRMISQGRFGGDWFLEITQRFQEFSGSAQNETNFVGGLTILFAP